MGVAGGSSDHLTPLRILVVTNDFPPKVGGANYYVSEIVGRLRGGDVTVLASAWPDADAFDRTFPHRVVRWPSGILLPTPAVRRAVLDLASVHRPDVVVFGASFPLALIGVEVKRRLGVPYASFTHGLELAAARLPPGRWFLRRLGATAALVTAVSRSAHAQLRPFIGAGTRFDLLPSGIDPGPFNPAVGVEAVRIRHRLGRGPVICCVSRLVPRKGQDQVIRSLESLAADWPDIRFLVVGAGSYEAALRRLAARHGVSGRVVFAGEVPYAELPAYFRAGDVFVMPCRSRYGGLETEALGAVYLQASAVGRPCVAGRVGGAPEAVRHGETGLVVDGTSVAEITDAVRELLRDPDRARAMGAAGAEWVRREWTWDAMAARFGRLLCDCVGAARTA
jgi:phosphatidylinositol alpha-1,6-mannosyltransferase